MKMVKT